MAALLKSTEAVPGSYPTTPTGLSVAAAALVPAMIWQRIEAYTATRYTSRAIVWTVEGDGEWVPPLTPATIATVEEWTGTAWEAVTLSASPLGGYDLPTLGPYRFTGTVGGGAVPEAVNEAFRRLAEYMASPLGTAGATSQKHDVGSVSVDYSRSASWIARAMINSGAADLLRPYRSAA